MDNSSFNGQAQNGVDTEKARRFVQKKIYEYLILRGQQQSSDLSAKRMIDLTRLLDKALFNAASTLDEYMNLDTLENRLLFYLKQLRNTQNQRLQQQQQMNSGLTNQNQNQNQQALKHSSGYSSTMIPTPGYQQPTSVSPTTWGNNNMVSSMGEGGEKILSEMLHDYCQLNEDSL